MSETSSFWDLAAQQSWGRSRHRMTSSLPRSLNHSLAGRTVPAPQRGCTKPPTGRLLKAAEPSRSSQRRRASSIRPKPGVLAMQIGLTSTHKQQIGAHW